MKAESYRALMAGVICAAAVPSASAQDFRGTHPLPAPRGNLIAQPSDSGILDNPSAIQKVVWSQVVAVPSAAWERLHFGAWQLGAGSFVRASSVKDGEVHVLTADQLREWNNSSAYFNGSAVLLELVAAAGSAGNRVTLQSVEVEIPAVGTAGDPGLCGICGADNRVTSTQPSIGRTMPNGCTAALYTPWGCTVSAGHCGGPNMQVIQFNVPASNSDCTLNMPPVNDQFPFLRNTGGGPFEPGSDWNVGVTGRNSDGQTAYQKYNVFWPLATQRGTAFQAIDVYGYGLNTTCTLSQTQQRSPGAGITTNPPPTTYFYTIGSDIREGNSGSPVMRQGKILGVATHCLENCPPNYATIVDLPVFAETRRTFCPCPADFNVDGVADFFDYLDFVDAFSHGSASADFNGDTVIDFFDYLDFVDSFSTGC